VIPRPAGGQPPSVRGRMEQRFGAQLINDGNQFLTSIVKSRRNTAFADVEGEFISASLSDKNA